MIVYDYSTVVKNVFYTRFDFTSMANPRIAVCQMASKSDKEKNIESALSLLDKAADKKADMAALPEMFTYMGKKEMYRSVAEEVPGTVSAKLADKAREHGMWVHGGSMFEIADEQDKVHNTTVVFDPAGEIQATYRKIHLFDVEIGDEVVTQESRRVVAGDNIVTFDTKFATIGLSICYDLRFPELFSSLADKGADIIVLPAAFTKHTGKDHWETLLRARAIETQSYVVAPGQIGPKPDSVPSYGRSLIVDPWGNVVSKASDMVGVTTAEIDLEYLNSVQKELPSLKHKRQDTYTI
jgi:predicted amidohydrolase